MLSTLALAALPLLSAAPPKPNVVVLLCDDLGYGDLGCFGHPTVRTPNLDKLAADGVKLTHCYAAAPVCSPSRAALMTGRHPYRYGIRDWIPADSKVHLRSGGTGEITVARLLKGEGYRTALVGKWHLNSRLDGSEPLPAEHGFDHWFATQNNAAPSHQNPSNFVRNGKPVGPLQGNSSALIVDEAVRFLDAGPAGQPFFLHACFHAPHEPVAVPDEDAAQYAAEPDPTRRAYLASVTVVDREVGRLLAELDRRKLRDNTLVFFTSDNGPETLNRYKAARHSHGSPGGLRGMKLHVTEGGIRVPGILHWPGRTKPGTVCAEPVGGIDLLPTLCELSGATVPADRFIDGASFAGVFDGKPVERKVPLYWQYDKALGPPWKVATRRGDWKLLADGKLTRFALYNLADDPAETKDRSADEPGRLAEMTAELVRLNRQVNAGSGNRE